MADRHSRREVLRLAGAAGSTAALAGLPGAGPALAQAAPKKGGVLRVSVTQRVAHLSPLRHIHNPEYMAGELMNSGLVSLDYGKMAPDPDVAETWETTPDATEWVFTLKDNVYFHHGPKVTAEDVVATFRAILDPKTASPGLKNVGPIGKVEALDARRVRFTLTGPFADFPVSLTHSNAKIVPADVIARDIRELETKDFGCGPFKLDRYEPGRLLRVVRHEKYHRPGMPYVDAVEQILYPDLSGEAAAAVNGEVDIILMAAPTEFPRLSKTAGLVGMRAPSGRFHNLVMRTDAPPFNDIRVRRALALAVDRQACVDLVLEGLGRTAADNPISPEYPYGKPGTAPKPNVAEAKKLLAEAGHAQGLKIQLVCSNRPPTRTQLGVALKEMARPAGFDIEVQTIPHDTYLANVWRKGNFYVGTFNMQPHEDAMFTLLFTTDAPWNDTQWNNKRFDELVYTARRTLDAGKRRELYGEAQKLVTAEVPYIIPFYEDLLSVRRNYVNGYTVHPRGGTFFMERVWLGDGAPKRG